MVARRLGVPALALLTVLTFSGCPLLGSMVPGTWTTQIDDGCDTSVNLNLGMHLYNDGTAELYAGPIYTGTWTITDSVITIAFTAPGTLTFTATVSGNSMVNGTVAGDVTGCFTAEKLPF